MARKMKENEEKTKASTENGEEIISFDEPTVEAKESETTVDVKDRKIIEQQDEIERIKNTQLRLQADFENYKKRNLELSRKSYFDGGADAIVELLPLFDTFDRAVSILPEDDASGILMIKKQLDNILVKLGVQEIEAIGKDFDAKYHNAVMQVEDEENADKVVEVLQKGYTYKEKIIRHSMVKVAK